MSPEPPPEPLDPPELPEPPQEPPEPPPGAGEPNWAESELNGELRFRQSIKAANSGLLP